MSRGVAASRVYYLNMCVRGFGVGNMEMCCQLADAWWFSNHVALMILTQQRSKEPVIWCACMAWCLQSVNSTLPFNACPSQGVLLCANK